VIEHPCGSRRILTRDRLTSGISFKCHYRHSATELRLRADGHARTRDLSSQVSQKWEFRRDARSLFNELS
jgi:hypothetical protein